MSPSSALQKLASSLSSGGSAAPDTSPPNSGRVGGGVLRGILQSIRAGLSVDSSSRSSRNGLEGARANTPSASQSQQTLVPDFDTLLPYWEEPSSEVHRSRLSSGPAGVGPTGNVCSQGLTVSGYFIPEFAAAELVNVSTASQREKSAPSLSLHPAGPPSAEMCSRMPAAAGPSVLRGSSTGIVSRKVAPAQVASSIRTAPAATLPMHRLSSELITNSSYAITDPVATLPDQPPPTPSTNVAWNICPDLPLHENFLQVQLHPSSLGTPTAATTTTTLMFPTSTYSGTSDNPAEHHQHHQHHYQQQQQGAPCIPIGSVSAPTLAPTSVERCRADEPTTPLAAAMAGGTGNDEGGSGSSGSDVGGPQEEVMVSAASPALVDHSGSELPGRAALDLPPKLGLRPASAIEPAAAAVNKAVLRLQNRQLPDRVAGRLHSRPHSGHQHTSLHHKYTLSAYNQQPVRAAAAGASSSPGSLRAWSNQQLDTPGTQRLLSATSDASSCANIAAAFGLGADAAGDTPAPPAAVLPPGYGHGHINNRDGSQCSPARRLGLHLARCNSSVQPHIVHENYQHMLMDCHRNVQGSPFCTSSTVAAQGGKCAPPASAAVGEDTGLDAWLGGDVPDIFRRRAPRHLGAEARSSVSFTEGHLNAAERLQAMVSSAAVSGDEAASFLQQLLLPDVSSTASAELQYSCNMSNNATGTSAAASSVLALAFGSSSGPACAAPSSGVWGGTCTGSPMAPSHGDGLLSQPALCSGTGRYISGVTTAADWYPGSGAASRASSCVFGPTTRLVAFSGTHVRSAVGLPTVDSGAGGVASLAATDDESGAGLGVPLAVSLHAHKPAAQLVDELRQVCAAEGPDVADVDLDVDVDPAADDDDDADARVAGLYRRMRSGFDLAMGPFGDTAASCRGSGPHAHVADQRAAAAPTPDPQQQAAREELVAALWRLVHAKDSEAVSYLLGLDPAAPPNRCVAPLLNDMRSWVYLNMW